MIEGGGRRLRIGIMLASWIVPAWIGKVIRDIQTSDFTELDPIILNQAVPEPRHPLWNRLFTFNISPEA
jgi:hypothetical protein